MSTLSYWEVRFTQKYPDRDRNYTLNFVADDSKAEIEQLRSIMSKVVARAEDVRNVYDFRYRRKYLVFEE